ncbi:MAG: hypothetical protein J3K34DRAFT_522004 [Monoraphidium minutum]|nr:MAG: hypothetical protein J3K34DRAFT_522004 [Monoraphidium minutum]
MGAQRSPAMCAHGAVPPPEVVLDAARGAEARPGLAALLSPRNVLLFNGRLAMMGFAAGALGELATHQPLGAQLAAAGPHAAAAWVLLAAASAAPLLRGVLEGDEVFGPFNPASEMLNGKVAIAGLLALLAIEALKGSALL